MRMTTMIRRIIGDHLRCEERVGRGRLRLTPGKGPALARPGRAGETRRGLGRTTFELNAAFRRVYEALRCCGRTRVSPRSGIKFVSELHRGTMCRWIWCSIPAPATFPWFTPTLNPSGA